MTFLKNFTVGTFISLSYLAISPSLAIANRDLSHNRASLEFNNNDKNSKTLAASSKKSQFQLPINFEFKGSQIVATFTPKNSSGKRIPLQELAKNLGYDHFNWVSYVEQDPYGINDYDGKVLSTPYNDPPQGGYQYDAADRLPFYWDLTECEGCRQQHNYQNSRITQTHELVFEDIPADYRLQAGESIEFITYLVGVKNFDAKTEKAEWEAISTFRWKLTNVTGSFSTVSLIEKDLSLSSLPTSLLEQMQADGAILPEFDRVRAYEADRPNLATNPIP
jgi:hypothetical protein